MSRNASVLLTFKSCTLALSRMTWEKTGTQVRCRVVCVCVYVCCGYFSFYIENLQRTQDAESARMKTRAHIYLCRSPGFLIIKRLEKLNNFYGTTAWIESEELKMKYRSYHVNLGKVFKCRSFTYPCCHKKTAHLSLSWSLTVILFFQF